MAVSCLLKITSLVLLSKVTAFHIHPAFRTYLGAVPYQYPPREYYSPRRYVEQTYLPPALSQISSPPPPAASTSQPPDASNPAPERQSPKKFNSTILEALNGNLKNGTGKMDSEVLNNLAIALQLLIVNNLLNASPEIEKHANSTLALANEIQSYSKLPCKSLPKSLANFPNANFLGSSSLSDSGAMSIYSGPYVPAASPHVVRHLKSPYEAIAAPISPFDRCRTGFKSPYQSIMQESLATDLFSF